MLEFIIDWSRDTATLDVELFGEFITNLDLSEAEYMLDDLSKTVAELREATTNYVQVRFDLAHNSAAQAYTYADPSGTLKVGDLVQAPVRGGELNTAKVVALGRGSWNGPVKSVATKLEATPL